MTAAEGEALTLQERISAIAQYVDRADALAAMILAVLDDTQDDIEAGTHAFLLIDQLATSVVDRSGPVCCDADDLFLEFVGVDRATYDALTARVYRREEGAEVELAVLDELRAGIPNIEAAIDAVGAASNEFRQHFTAATEEALARITQDASLFVDSERGGDRVVALPVANLGLNERILIISCGCVSWISFHGIVAVSANVAAYMCAELGGVDLGPDAPLPDAVPFLYRVGAALNAGAELDGAYASALVRAAEAPCNQT